MLAVLFFGKKVKILCASTSIKAYRRGYLFSGFKQSSKLVMWNKYHLSIKGIGEVVPFPSKMVYKRVKGLDPGAEAPHIKLFSVPTWFL